MSFPDPHHDHHRCTQALLARAERVCAERGSRLTGQRREVLACVAAGHEAVGAYDIIERMAGRGPRPAPITVYRALDFLLDHNLVHKVESRNAFVACSCAHDAGPSVLLICEACGAVSENAATGLGEGLAALAARDGFVARRTVIEMTGRCARCAAGGA